MAAPSSYKVILLGTIEVGKTSLIVRFVDGTFTDQGINNFDKKEKQVGNVKLQLQDTAGQERFRTLTSSYYRKAHAIIIVYDCTNRESFDDVVGFIKEGVRYSAGSAKFIVANKIDLSERIITPVQGQTLANEHNIPYFEVSALSGAGVNELFAAVASKLAGPGDDVPAAAVAPVKSGGGGGGCTLI